MTSPPDGETLAERLARSAPPLAIDDAVEVGVLVAEALDALHQRGAVHGGLSPHRVWLAGGRATLEPAAPVGPGEREPTPAREVLAGGAPDARSDHFALGCLLYEMVAGRPPFEGSTPDEVAAAVGRGGVAPLSDYQPLVPPSLARIVTTCLDPDPDRRWQSARDLGRELAWVGTLDEPASDRLEDETRESQPLLYAVIGLAAGVVLSAALKACG